jgi:hypothetical protein
MTDVMTTAFTYPDEPLPGPRVRNLSAWAEAMDTGHVVDYDFYRKYTEKHGPPQPSPILESPMYFPGLAWKGTAGMPGRYGEVVYA